MTSRTIALAVTLAFIMLQACHVGSYRPAKSSDGSGAGSFGSIEQRATWSDRDVSYEFEVSQIVYTSRHAILHSDQNEGYSIVTDIECIAYKGIDSYLDINIGDIFMIDMNSVSEIDFYRLGLWRPGEQARGTLTSYSIDGVVVFSELTPILFSSDSLCGLYRRR